MTLQDVYGNRYTYAHLGSVAEQYPVPRQDATDPDRAARALKANGDDQSDPKPSAPASAGRQVEESADEPALSRGRRPRTPGRACRSRSACSRTRTWTARARPAGSTSCSTPRRASSGSYETYRNYFSRPFGLDPKKVTLRRLRKGSRVIGGTIIGRVGRTVENRAAARRLLDSPGRPGRAADRPEADPRRLEAARGDRDLPRVRPQRAARRRRGRHVDRPDPAAAQAAARAARAGRRAHRGLRRRPRRHPLRPDRPARAGDAGVPRRVRPAADRDLPQVRPRLLHQLGQRLASTAPATRSTSPRSTASRSSATRRRAASPSRPCAG